MLTTRQGLSFAKIKQIATQRVVNSIEAIAIYETKICVAHDSMDPINVARAYTTGSNGKSGYAGKAPFCNRCKLHHTGPCTVKCSSCTRVGHMTRDYTTPVPITTQRPPIANQKLVVTCFGYCAQGHFKSECPKLKNQNHGNQKGKKRKARKDPNVIINNANAYGEIFPALHSET
ncbi:hypothetical protein Tco_1367289 [Tanacetum coccineum]